VGLKERKRREREARKELILDAARSLLFEKGLTSTSINQIARRAEIGVGTIYFYYKNKEELFAALQEEGLEIMGNRIREAYDSGTNPEERLRKMAHVYLDFSTAHKEYFDIINYFLSSPDVIFTKELKQEVDQQGDNILSVVQKTIHQGIESDAFHDTAAHKSAIMFWGMLHGLVQLKKMRDTLLKDENYEELFDYSVEKFIRGLKFATV
jgi:AcrR family transcriptional regulator